MRGIILAAGRGSRMGDATSDRPKCLVELSGVSLLDRQCAALRKGGVTEIGLVRGYRGEVFENRGLTLFDNPRWAESNMVVSLTCAAPWLRTGPCIVSYSDIFYAPATVAALASAGRDIAIAYDSNWQDLWQRRFADLLSDAETFRRDQFGRVIEIGARAKSPRDIEGQYMGLLSFTPAGWTAVEHHLAGLECSVHDRLDMTGLLSRLIQAGIDVYGVAATGAWGEVDSLSDLALYEELARRGEITFA